MGHHHPALTVLVREYGVCEPQLVYDGVSRQFKVVTPSRRNEPGLRPVFRGKR